MMPFISPVQAPFSQPFSNPKTPIVVVGRHPEIPYGALADAAFAVPASMLCWGREVVRIVFYA